MPDTPEAMGPHLRLVCVNDVYSLEHLPRLAGLVRRFTTSDPPDQLLVILAGDFVAPSLLSSIDAGRGMVECLNAVGVTHVIFGNHEDDVSTEALRERVREFAGTWINTNVTGFEPTLPRSQVRVVRARGGPDGRAVRVGLVGVVMNDPAVYRRPPFGVASVEPANESARREADRLLREDGCACVVALTHQPVQQDRALAREQRDPPFAVIVGGHEHSPYAEQVEGTWITKSGMDATHARVIDLRWPAEAPDPTVKIGALREGSPAPAPAPSHVELPEVSLAMERVADYPEDPAVAALVAKHQRCTDSLRDATLLTVAPGSSLTSVDIRRRQTSFGTLLCSLVREALEAEACLFNSGGIRASRMYTQRFTYADLEAELPFDNEVVCVPLPGWLLRDAVAFSRSRGESGGFLQLDDRCDARDGVLTRVAGAPLDEFRVYRVALVRDFFAGLDRIEPLVNFAREHPESVPPTGSGRPVKLLLIEALSRALWDQLGGFAALDPEHRGRVRAPELAEALRKTHSGPAAELVAALMLSALDANHDGAVAPDEVRRRGRDE